MQYDYKCSACKEVFQRILKMNDRKIPESEPCPSCNETGTVCQTIINAPKLGFRTITKKPESGFNEVLRDIKAGNKGSTINIHD